MTNKIKRGLHVLVPLHLTCIHDNYVYMIITQSLMYLHTKTIVLLLSQFSAPPLTAVYHIRTLLLSVRSLVKF